MNCRTVAIALAAYCALAGFSTGQSEANLYARGKAALDSGRYQEADADFAQVEQLSPGKTNALGLRAKALIHLREFEQAQYCLEVYLKNHAESVDGKYLLAYVLFRRDRPRESLAAYTAAAAVQPPTADDFKIIGLNYVLLNDYPDAVKWLERSVNQGGKDAEAVYYLGRAYYVQNQFDKAIVEFQRALSINPRFAKAENNLGLAFAGKNEPALAEAAYRKAIQMGGTSAEERDQPYLNLAELLSHTDRQGEALSLVDEAERMSGKSERAEELRGQILLAQSRLKDAETAFRSAISMKPDDGALHFLLGRVLKREGQSDAAEREFAESKALRGRGSPTAN